jgi:DNA-3-methyladenine glycosylase II
MARPGSDEEIERFELHPSAPYSLRLTAARFARFDDPVDRFDGETYRRLLRVGPRLVQLEVTQIAPPSRPRLAIALSGAGARSAEARAEARRFVARALGTSHELRAFYRQLGGDPLLRDAIRRERGLSVAGFGDAFESVVTAILTQQVNLAFAFSIRAELARSFGRRARIGGRTWIAFPAAERLAREEPEALRRCRLSGAKAEALVRVARAFASGELADAQLAALDDEAVIERLIAHKGIGRWTAETVLLRGLARRDAFPAGDLGVVKYLAQGLLGRRAPAGEAQMRAFARRWQPYRAYALVYASAELAFRRSPTPPPRR